MTTRGPRLPRSFYARRPAEVAPDLLGRVLVHRMLDGSMRAAAIVETEAYDFDDPASHSFGGQTPRNAVMFGRAGHLYVYLSYGIHFCMNVVAGTAGEGCAVLLRAGRPLEGVDAMRAAREGSGDRILCAGPGRFTQAFGVDRSLDGADLVGGRSGIWIATGAPVASGDVLVGPRIGVTRGAERLWRFAIAGDPFISRRASAMQRAVPSKR